MTQPDKKELSEVARSIAALFGGEEGLDTKATVPSSGVAEHHVEVGVALGLEPVLDTGAEQGLAAAPGDELDGAAETPSGVRGHEATDAIETEAVEAVETEATDGAEVVEMDAVDIGQTPDLDPARAETSQVLIEATSRYLEAPMAEKEAARGALQAAVEAARSAGGLDEIASSVNVLLLRGAGDMGVEGLAAQLMDDDVLSRMVAELGRIRIEEEREALIEAYVGLGNTVAEEIAHALTNTEDRLARKTYVAALAAFGSAGAQAVEKMLRDSRWFVVRNGVSVLGAVGGQGAIEPLTATLANEHAGVRKETVRSLARIGGENAGLLVSSMLGDSDAEVRAAAARAVSALKVERAYKQLMEILKDGDEEAVIEQVLRALGALGDPSAVPAIEKRMKGSLLSRPPKGVRLAGLAALAAIGTPHAVSLVEKARTDKDSEISSAAAQLLAGR